MKYWKRWIADYAGKTQGLSLSEHGAYALLLDEYYAHEGPLPADSKSLYRICGAQDVRERAAVNRVVELFFTRGDDGMIHNERADAYLREGAEFADKASIFGKKGAQARWGNREEKPRTNGAHTMPPGFEEFWVHYPRKVGKAAAEKAWKKLSPSQDLISLIHSAIDAHSKSPTWTSEGGRYIPHAATWLNGARWNDEVLKKPEQVWQP